MSGGYAGAVFWERMRILIFKCIWVWIAEWSTKYILEIFRVFRQSCVSWGFPVLVGLG